MNIILYKGKWSSDLNDSNKLEKILRKMVILPDIEEVIRYTFKKYENIDNIFDILWKIDLSNNLFNNECMVINYGSEKYIWEYYNNWIKIRKHE